MSGVRQVRREVGRRAVLLAPLAGAGLAAAPAPVWATLPPTPALPTPAASGRVTRLNAALYYAVYGQGDPVLLLHGGLANAAWFGHLIPLLARKHQVIVTDARGHGRSTLGEGPLTYGALAEDAAAVLDHLRLARAAVVGWSDGGIAGLLLAIKSPGRVSRLFAFGANINRGGVRPDAGEQPTVRQYVARCAREHAGLTPEAGSFPRLQQALRGMWQAGPGIGPAELGGIRISVVIGQAEHDEFIIAGHAAWLASVIPGGRRVVLPGVSHFALLQDPAGFAGAVLPSIEG